MDLVGVLGLAGILALSATTGQEDAALSTWGLAALTVATCAALLPLVHPGSWDARVLGIPPLQWIGARSYGIYLWHMPVVAFLPDRVLFGQPVLRGLLIVALTLLLAALSWRLVEDPIRRHGLVAALARARGVLGVGAVAVLASGALVLTAALPETSAQEIAAQEPAASEGDAVAHPALDGRTSCTSVLHVGDSTSLASGNTDRTRIADPAQRITRALVDATARHPDLRVHDWARESRSHPDWYLSDDANHNTEAGAVAKARSMAAALTAAFPAGRPASAEKVVLGE